MNSQDQTIPVEKLVIAVSSRALFNLDESHAIFENEGVDALIRGYQMMNERRRNPDRFVFFGCMLCVIVLAGMELIH